MFSVSVIAHLVAELQPVVTQRRDTRRAAEEFRFAFPQNLELSTLIGTLSSPRWSELILVT
jgi:hypothetical protein